MRDLSVEEKKQFGQALNDLKRTANEFFENKRKEIETEMLNQKLAKEKIDISLPSKRIKRGSKHPMSRIQEDLEDL